MGPCRGEMEFSDGVMIVDCTGCKGGCQLARRECFLGISGRLIPGFQGGVVLRGVRDRYYEGPVVEALSSHSRILGEIRRLGKAREKRSGPARSFSKLCSDMESAFMKDPGDLVSGEKTFRKRMLSTIGKGPKKEIEVFDSIIESTSLMMRKLERELSRQGND